MCAIDVAVNTTDEYSALMSINILIETDRLFKKVEKKIQSI